MVPSPLGEIFIRFSPKIVSRTPCFFVTASREPKSLGLALITRGFFVQLDAAIPSRVLSKNLPTPSRIQSSSHISSSRSYLPFSARPGRTHFDPNSSSTSHHEPSPKNMPAISFLPPFLFPPSPFEISDEPDFFPLIRTKQHHTRSVSPPPRFRVPTHTAL